VYGGWRGLYCAGVEAWTGYPSRLDDAIDHGTYSNLRGREGIDCKTMVIGYDRVSGVESVRPDGTVGKKLILLRNASKKAV